MKQFNKTISIEISVDAIAQQMLALLPETIAGREQITECIIGTALNSQAGLNPLFNSINGYTNDISLKVGDCVSFEGMPQRDYGTNNKVFSFTSGQIVEIDLYATNKVLVAYTHVIDNIPDKQVFAWINHTYCSIVM